MAVEICPYCFERFALAHTPFRCCSPAAQCAPQPDEVQQRHWKTPTVPILGRVIAPPGRFVRRPRCPECRYASHKRICPHCHMNLPTSIGEHPNLIFAIVGAADSGKSHFISVLVQQIQQVVGPSLDILLEPLDETDKRYRERFKDPLYNQHKTVGKTFSGISTLETRLPLIFSMTFSRRTLFGRKEPFRVVTLVFFDTAGEDLVDLDVMSSVNKYIYLSDGIILLLDPLQLPRVRDQLGSEVALPDIKAETSEIVTRITRLIQLGRQMKQTDRFDTPLALAFSKFDAVERLVDPQFQLLAQPNHERGFDLRDFQAVNAEMQSLVAQWNGQFLLQQVEARFRSYGFFGLSALGCNPHGTDRVPRVLPHRVEDPFLWLLHQHKLLVAAKH